MQKLKGRSPLTILFLTVCLLALSLGTQAQKTSQTKTSTSDDDVVRVKTELIQTDIIVDDKMGAGDRVAILSTSGQIGFLQQLTDNKSVLREAISRIQSKYDPETTASRVKISEVDANLVANHSDRGLFTYLVIETMREFQMQSPFGAITLVKNRVQQVNAQAKNAEQETLSRLESLVRSTAPLTGRKVV